MYLDWIAAILTLAGVYIIGCKNRWGFIICIFSGIVWCVVAIEAKLYGIILGYAPLIVINVINFIKWGKK